MNEEPHVSASQIKEFDLCARKWAYRKIEGREAPGGKGSQEGGEYHKWMQRYHNKEYEYDDLPKVCQAVVDWAAEHAPYHGPELQVEGVYAEVDFEWNESGIKYVGSIDVLDIRDPKHIVIYDYKFLKDPVQYALSPYELERDPQAVLYAMAVLAEYEEAEDVRLCWLNVDKRSGTHPISPCVVKFTKFGASRAIWPAYEKYVLSSASSIWGHYKLTDDADSVVANPMACGAYGGCPHASYCNAPELSAKELINNLFGKAEDVTTMALPPNLKKPSIALVSTSNAAAASGTNAPAARKFTAPTRPAIPAVKAAPAVPAPAAPKPAAAATVKRFVPNAPVKPAPVEDPLAFDEEEELAEEELEETVLAEEPEVEEEPEPAPPPVKRGRGRPPGSKNKPKDPDAPAPKQAAAVPAQTINELITEFRALREQHEQLYELIRIIGVGAGYLEGDDNE